jgi:hypothetical protein
VEILFLILFHIRKARWSTRRDQSLQLCIPCETLTSSLRDPGDSALVPASMPRLRRVEALWGGIYLLPLSVDHTWLWAVGICFCYIYCGFGNVGRGASSGA